MRIDLTGKKFGKLTVIKEAEQKGYIRYWQCKCECGTIKNIRQVSLTSGNSKSCGCIRKGKVLTGKRFGILTALEIIGRKNGKSVWKCKCDCGNYVDVVSTRLTAQNTKSCGCLKKKQEKENLRVKYNDQYVEGVNAALLKAKKRIDNKSGVKGVAMHKPSGEWDAYIGYAGKQIFLGRFKNKIDAIKARKQAEEKYHDPYIKALGEKENRSDKVERDR